MEFNKDDFIVYTSLIGKNEGLNSQPCFSSSNLRHVCLTDDENLISDDWEIILVDRILPEDCHRSQRHFKIRPHIVFPNYKYSLYLDNTVVLKKKTEDFIKMILKENFIFKDEPFFLLPYHSQFDLISEFNACASNNLDDQIRINEQLNHYINTNSRDLKRKAYWGAILLRSHNDSEIIKLSEIWFSHICRYSRRDQLSIIHASSQSNIVLKGFELKNSDSEYHVWPVTRNKRDNRNFKANHIQYIPENYLEILSKKINENKNLLLKLDENKKILNTYKLLLRIKNFYKKFKEYIKKLANHKK